MPKFPMVKVKLLDDEDSEIALDFSETLADLFRRRKLKEDISEVFAEHYLDFRTAVAKRRGRTKVWNQTAIYGHRTFGRKGVCWALCYMWLVCYKNGTHRDLEQGKGSVPEDLEWLLELQSKCKSALAIYKLLRIFLQGEGLRVKDPYIATTNNPVIKRRALKLDEGIGVACVGSGLYTVLDLDGKDDGHSVATLLHPGGVSIFFDPNLGRAIFTSAFDMKLFMLEWIPKEYPWISSACVDRYHS